MPMSYEWYLPSRLFNQHFVSSFPCAPHAPPISSSLTSSPWDLVKSTNYGAPHYAIFSTPPHFIPLRPKYSLKKAYLVLKHPQCVLPLTWGTRFHTHTEQQIKL
jgi:hypothetical protein